MKNSARKPVREATGIDAIIKGLSLVLVSESREKYRLQANLSQPSLAVKLGVHLETLGSWERGQSTPNRRSWSGLRALLAEGVEPVDVVPNVIPVDVMP